MKIIFWLLFTCAESLLSVSVEASVVGWFGAEMCLFAVIRSWSPSSPSTLTRPTASASSLTPRGNTSPQEVPTPWSACGTWRNWCVSVASPGQSVCVSVCVCDMIILLCLNLSFVLIVDVVVGWTGLWGRWASAMTARCWPRPPRITS